MLVLCTSYVCASLCYSSNLLRHVKIATPTALSAIGQLNQDFFAQRRNCEIDLYDSTMYHLCRNTRLCFTPTRFSGRKCSAAGFAAGEKSALLQLQTSNDTCVVVESKLRRVQDRALNVYLLDDCF